MNDRVTVVTVTYNASSSIERTIQSVLSQDYDNYEYFIIDGASTDDTVKIVEQYLPIECIFVGQDKGIFDAMNKGIDHASGDWIIFMNAGDVFASDDVLSKTFASKVYSQGTGVLFGRVYWGVKEVNKIRHVRPFFENTSKIKPMGFNHQAVFVRVPLAKMYRFDTDYKVSADYNQISKIYKAGHEVRDICLPIAVFDLTGFSSNNRLRKLHEEAMICGMENSLQYKMQRYLLKIKLFLKKILHR